MMNSADFRRFFEDKDRLIDRLDLTNEQKAEAKAFFKVHPNYENKLDWNNKNLTWEDFQKVLELEGTSKNSKKKYGLSGKAQIEDLVEDKDYKVLAQTDDYTIYYPMNFKASEVLAKPTTPPEGVQGKWCISGKNYSPGTQDQHWNSYTSRGFDFFFIFLNHTKWAAARHPSNEGFSIFDEEDTELSDWSAIYDQGMKFSDFKAQQQEIKKICEETPRALEGQMYKEDKDGNTWSMDGKELVKVNDNLPVLKVPEGTARIKWRAANHRTSLQYLTIPDRVILEDEAFAYCWGLKEINLGKNIVVPSASTPFSKARGKVIFADGTTFIPAYIFSDSNISEVILPEGLEVIRTSAFMSCGLLESIKLPKSLTSIEAWAFGETRFNEIKIPTGLEFLGEYAFCSSTHLKEIEIPGSAWVIRNGVFRDCESLEKVKLGWGIEIIGQRVFTNCNNLKELYLPSTLTEINRSAFMKDYAETKGPNMTIYFSGTKDQFNTLTNDPVLYFMRSCRVIYTDQFYNEVR